MKPYIELDGEKIFLPQAVDPYKYEVCIKNSDGTNFFLLCKKVSKRYSQATGVVMEKAGKELIFHKAGAVYVQRTFPLAGMETATIKIDWQATSTSTISNEE